MPHFSNTHDTFTDLRKQIKQDQAEVDESHPTLGIALRHVSLACRAYPDLSKDQVIALLRINNDRVLVEATLQLVEETRRWRYNLVQSGILDIEGKPLKF